MNDRLQRERLNFFTGLFTTSEDWTAEQDYHREGIKLHSQWQHNVPGIIPEYKDEFTVVSADDLVVRVLPGAAVDSGGNLLLLTEATELTIDVDELVFDDDGKATVYVCTKFHEDKTAYIENVEQPQYSDFSRIKERPRVFITGNEPNNSTELALARLVVVNPDSPVVNKIDTRKAPRSVTVAQHQARLEKQGGQLTDLKDRLDQLSDNSRLHTRGLHTHGIIREEAGGLNVTALGGLDIQVADGAALDDDGKFVVLDASRILTVPVDQYSLPALVYIVISSVDGLHLTTSKPDDGTQIELAHIDLQPGVTEIREPDDPLVPKANEINQRDARSAGAVGIVERWVEPETLRQLVQAMRDTRRDFVALDERFPTPSVVDVRHASLTVETIAHIGHVRPGQLPELMAALFAIEQDVGQEIDRKYGNIVNAAVEYHAYLSALQTLDMALKQRAELDIITAQYAVAEAARELSEMGIESPIADAGPNQTLSTVEDEQTTVLDANRSRGRGNREIDSYRWDVIE